MDSITSISLLILIGVLRLAFWLVPLGALLYLGYYCISLPMRRMERTRLFLDIVETGLRRGRSLEESIISVSLTRDQALGKRFLTLGFLLSQGQPFSMALEKVPQLLPPQISAMLKAGAKIGDLRKVLPACRQLLNDAVSQTRGALNFLLVMAFIVTPVAIAVFTAVVFMVLPKCIDIAANMDITVPWGLSVLVHGRFWLVMIQLSMLAFVWALAFFYIGGPRLHGTTDSALGFLWHRVCYALPWRRKRLHRDFSAILAVLLDSGVPEPEALKLAAECTGNEVFKRHAGRAVAALQQGVKLTEALQIVDRSGEFRWRLANAIYSRGGFSAAIAGWIESLDARAYQQEQATAQTVTTGLVLLNGVFVGTVAIGVFSMLLAIVNGGML